MRLGLSSAAAPDASLEELIAACHRRGLQALELEVGHGHLLDPRAGSASQAARQAAEARSRVAAAGISLAGLRLSEIDRDAPDLDDDAPAGRDAGVAPTDLVAFVRSLGAPLLVPASTVLKAPHLLDHGGLTTVLPPGEGALTALDALDRQGPHRATPLAWDVDPSRADMTAIALDLLKRAGPRLSHLRLFGGGPEAVGQEGRGIGGLMARLALAGFGGTLALAPTSSTYRVAWSVWLGRRGGWGCGSAAQDRTLVSLESP
jgi:hypothetical protein